MLVNSSYLGRLKAENRQLKDEIAKLKRELREAKRTVWLWEQTKHAR